MNLLCGEWCETMATFLNTALFGEGDMQDTEDKPPESLKIVLPNYTSPDTNEDHFTASSTSEEDWCDIYEEAAGTATAQSASALQGGTAFLL